MQLYGFQINEKTVSMQRKAYYCRLISDTDQLARQIKYYPLYESHGSLKIVFDHILSDRITLYAPIFQYVSAELQKHHIYHYDSARILDACDIVSGKYIAALMDIQEQCCEIVGALEEEMQLRQLRKDTRTRIGAIGSGVSRLAVGMLKAGAINAASGVIHSVGNTVGNLFSKMFCDSQIDELYHEQRTRQSLLNGMQADCRAIPLIIGQILQAEVDDTWQYPFRDFRYTDAKAICNQISQNMIPEEQWKQLLTTCIVNYAPYAPELYEYAEKTLGENDGHLLETAHFFSVSRYFQPKEENMRREQRFREYQTNAEAKPQAFFGGRLYEARSFLFMSHIDDYIYNAVEDVLSPDFNEMIKHILDFRMFINEKGEEDGQLFDHRTRRRMIFFEFDSPSLLGKQKFIQQFCGTCHANLLDEEEAYAFIDLTSTWTRSEGILITNRGLYFSGACNVIRKGEPLLYEKIDRMVCDPVLEVTYDGTSVKTKFPSNARINNFLIFACMYFKFGQFEKGDIK